MEFYRNTNDFVNTVKYFFMHYAVSMIIGLVMLILAAFGWFYWESQKTNMLQTSAQKFKIASTKFHLNSFQGIEFARNFFRETTNIYGAIIGLKLAQFFVENGDLVNAEKTLIDVFPKVKSENIVDLINIRLARIQLAKGQPHIALSSLKNIKSTPWQAVVQNLRGDILLYNGENIDAKSAYTQSLEITGSPPLKSLLILKLNNLSIS
ncbi:hypothetical protein GFV14_00109 [Candidatus Hartigia pinicola]|nr:hypothetical protein GFV14_00109 [Candidatus Hartigia pinicola]